MSLGARSKALSDLAKTLKSEASEVTKFKSLVGVNLQIKDPAHRSQILLNFMLMSHEEQEKSGKNAKHTEELLTEIKNYTAIAAIDKELKNAR